MTVKCIALSLLVLLFEAGAIQKLEVLKGAHPYIWRNGSQYPPFKGCEKDVVPPQKSDEIPTYSINLDMPPRQRWSKLVADKRKEILDLLTSIKNNSAKLFGTELFYIVDNYLPYLTRTLPEPYSEELNGISDAANIPLGEVTLLNVFYEFFSVCTSIIAQDRNGVMHHGRNLDFGLFLGWDVINNTWLTTEYLRPLVVKVKFTRKNETVFESVNFAGYIGILTAVKKGSFSLTVDERFKLNGGYVGISEWILGYHNQKWMGLLTREVMEKAEDFKTAQKMLAKPILIAPVYFILAGNSSKEGCIITRGRSSFEIWEIGSKHKYQNGSWYMVQTNYDHWENPPFYDNRRMPAICCMEELGREDLPQTLYKVLSTRPILNKLTTYTALMNVPKGKLEAFLRTCDDPCWPW